MSFSRPRLNVSVSLLSGFLSLGLLCASLTSSASAATTQKIEFNRDIRPILSENCFLCHGHDKTDRKAKLQLDDRDVAVARGAIVPFKPEKSKLVEHIFATDPDDIMPPPETHKKLTTHEKNLLREWIAQGAKYEPFWAYVPPKRAPVPKVKNARWVRNPIDAFILQKLEANKVSPSPEAAKGALLRRVSLDLIGLPPTLDELKAFLADKRPDAYERQVDRLLASPHFGERRAVPWLDVVRFADTVGYHGDQNQNVFAYRDYVIHSFNENKPFDQFTVEQLAGDLLPHPSTEARIATCFNRLNMMTREGGAQPKEYIAKYQADRVRTVSMAWMGSTMGCCECHDHKYDPFTSKDFYSMEAFFADLKQWGVYADYGYTPNPELKGVGNDHPFPPEIIVTNACLERRIAALNQQISNLYQQANATSPERAAGKKAMSKWRADSLAFLKAWPDGWASPMPQVDLKLKGTNSPAKSYTISSNGVIAIADAAVQSTKVTLTLPSMWVSAVRLEITPRDAPDPVRLAARKKMGSAFTLSAVLRKADGHKTAAVPFYFADADHKEDRFAMGLPIIGIKDLWQISTDHETQAGVWLLDKPFQAKAGDQLIVNLGNAAVKTARLSVTPFPAPDAVHSGMGATLKKALAKANWRRSAQEKLLVERTCLLTTQFDTNLLANDRDLESKVRDCRGGRARVMVSEAREEPLVTRVLPRGNWQDQSGEIVQPAVPHFLKQIPDPSGRRLTRLDLARWLISTDNPLTARTIVNRLWKQFFGTGISGVVDDLGAQGEWPTHPQLLDWLACEFMQPTVSMPTAGTGPAHAWDLKHIIRLMVTSETYRQASNERPDLKEIDPNNRLLAFETPRRLEAEFVRDNALSIAGLINLEIGGPSSYPYQPAGYYANLQFPERDYYADKDQRQYRRGVYTHWQRTFLQPMLANFDAPSREECVAARNVSNTPQQALTLLNDPTFVEASRVFAQHLLAAPKLSDSERLDRAFLRALARLPNAKEKASMLGFLAQQRRTYRASADDSAKLLTVGLAPGPPASTSKAEEAAWTQVCRVIMNLHETITIY